MNPTVSVIMPVYNTEKYVAEAIESILAQTFTDFEFIIVDDASTDHSLAIIEKYRKADPRIRVLKNDENLGLSLSLNKGLEIASGIYIARMDADDISLPNRFHAQVEFLDNNPHVWVLGGAAKKIDAAGNRTEELIYTSDAGILRWNMVFGQTGIVLHPSAMIRKNFFDETGYYQPLQTCQDLELWGRLIDYDPLPIKNLDEEILLYRWHDKNVGVTNTRLQNTIANSIRRDLFLKHFNFHAIDDEIDIIATYTGDYSYLYTSSEKLKIITCWFENFKSFSEKYQLTKDTKDYIYKQILYRVRVYITLNPIKCFTRSDLCLWRSILSLGLHNSWHIFKFKLDRLINNRGPR